MDDAKTVTLAFLLATARAAPVPLNPGDVRPSLDDYMRRVEARSLTPDTPNHALESGPGWVAVTVVPDRRGCRLWFCI
jgi:hypothetical protein